MSEDLLQKLEDNLIAKLKYKFCPECRHDVLKITIQTAENHLYCAKCFQEIFVDVDYTDCIKDNKDNIEGVE